ncbi:MAG: type IX secretion system sortase PorU [Bacteroidetes bacterium]|nr:type IX secretion system sortase PorU [Bacteroidota bacterium]
MKILFKNTFLLVLFSQPLFSQRTLTKPNLNTSVPVTLATSNIMGSSEADSVTVKVEVKNAQYDASKQNLPYYVISHKTPYSQTAAPHLIIKKTQIVTEPHASVIKKFLNRFVTNDFELKSIASLAAGENLNSHRLYPFRLNSSSQVEELIDYEISWQVSANSNRQLLSQSASFANASVLASGTWYKIGLTKSGVYKIDKTFLANMGINVATLDPKNIRIYGNGGKTVPELNSDFRYDDLQENSIQVMGESDGIFDNSDYVLFYGTSVNPWVPVSGERMPFKRLRNYYSDTSFYFLNVDLGPGKRIVTKPSSVLPPTLSTSSFDYYNFHELDLTNFIKSGRQFFGEYFDLTNSYTFSFTDGNFVTGDSIFAEVGVAGRALNSTVFSVSGNGINGSLNTNGVNINFYLDPYADAQSAIFSAINNNPSVISMNVTKQTAASIGWMDNIEINARRNLVVNNSQFQFRDSRVTGNGKVCNFSLSNPSNLNISVWNISDPLNPFNQLFSISGSSINFNSPVDSLMEFALFPDNSFYTPSFSGKTANQNLHAVQQADYVIVTHPLFISYAQRLANLHQQNEGLTYVIATTEQVYNEFGSGKPDAAAIRDFIRMLYTRNFSAGKQPKYALLLGDGSYDNKNRNLGTNSNLIPTYQTPQSTSVLQSTASDDFYALMDPSEGFNAESVGALDVGVGRLTCRSAYEVNAIVTKIENYYRKDPEFKIADTNIENCTATSTSPYGDWRNWLVFMGDDKDQATHMQQANSLSGIVQTAHPLYNMDKIYLDAYRRFSTPGGERYPDARADMDKRIRKGALVYNYTGHGGEVGLTDERVLDVELINSWDNFNALPLFITATCEFSRYDDPGRTSAGEYCLINPKGAAIGLLTTCRLAFSSTNFVLNASVFDYMFKKLPNGKMPALGDIIRLTKASLGQSIYYANFHLLGDPALRLAYPEQKVFTSKINTFTLSPSSSDTLGALSKITISGFVADTMGNKLYNFNGIVYPTVFDKVQDVSCLLNDPSSYDGSPGVPFKFKLQKNILYKGKAEVKNGDFTFSFMVPKDISFAYGPGKISYYATNGQTDATGYYQKIVVGGGAKNPVIDNEGPQVHLFLNDKNFVNGGTTNEKPILYANLTDSSGINTLGTGIGHDISVVLDQNTTKPVILNDYYEAALNSYQTGRVRYPFNELTEGNHRLTFKAWDIQNNSNIVNCDFVVAPSAELALTHVLNYPNPFTSSTKFFLEHNQACNPLKVTVQIFTISGKVVKTLQRSVVCEGFRPEGIDWDGKDDYGDKLGRGVYIYKVSILNTENKKAEKTEKLVILN